MRFADDQNCAYVHICMCVFLCMCLRHYQLVDKLNTDSNITDMQMDYGDVSCYVIAILVSLTFPPVLSAVS